MVSPIPGVTKRCRVQLSLLYLMYSFATVVQKIEGSPWSWPGPQYSIRFVLYRPAPMYGQAIPLAKRPWGGQLPNPHSSKKN